MRVEENSNVSVSEGLQFSLETSAERHKFYKVHFLIKYKMLSEYVQCVAMP